MADLVGEEAPEAGVLFCVAQQSGAKMAHLAGVGHWWPEQTLAQVAEALTHFWAELPDPEVAPATDSRR